MLIDSNDQSPSNLEVNTTKPQSTFCLSKYAVRVFATTLKDFAEKKLKCLVILSTTCWLKNLTCIFFKKLANVCYIRENTRELKSCLVISSYLYQGKMFKTKKVHPKLFQAKKLLDLVMFSPSPWYCFSIFLFFRKVLKLISYFLKLERLKRCN